MRRHVRIRRVRAANSIDPSPIDRKRLHSNFRDCNAAQKHMWLAEIVLLSADSVGTNEIMRRTGTSKTCIWRWQERFMVEGVDGLLCDDTRPSHAPPQS
jgi:leucine-zipper of insertion element IS481